MTYASVDVTTVVLDGASGFAYPVLMLDKWALLIFIIVHGIKWYIICGIIFGIGSFGGISLVIEGIISM